MIQAFGRNTSDVHTGTLPNCFQSLQDRDTVRIIGAAFCHIFLLLYNTAEPQKDIDLRQLLKFYIIYMETRSAISAIFALLRRVSPFTLE